MRERVVPLCRFRDSASLEARTSSNFSLSSASGWSSHSEFCRVSPLDIFHVQPVHVTCLSPAACWIENQTYAWDMMSRCIHSISGCHSDKTSAPTARLPNARHGKVSETVAAVPPIRLQRGQRGGSACIQVCEYGEHVLLRSFARLMRARERLDVIDNGFRCANWFSMMNPEPRQE